MFICQAFNRHRLRNRSLSSDEILEGWIESRFPVEEKCNSASFCHPARNFHANISWSISSTDMLIFLPWSFSSLFLVGSSEARVFTPSKYDENVSRRVARNANFRINNLKPSTRLIKDFGVSTIAIEVSIYSLAEINRMANLFQVSDNAAFCGFSWNSFRFLLHLKSF